MIQTIIILSSDIGASAIAGLLVFGVIALISWVRNKDVRERENDAKKAEQLEELKYNGILTKKEYKAKINEVLEQKLNRELLKTDEYKSLKKLKKQGLLTEQEFQDKINIIIEGGRKKFKKMK